MGLFLVGLLLFFVTHAVRLYADPLRTQAIAALGPTMWKLGYSVLSLLALVLIVKGYPEARLATLPLWSLPTGLNHFAGLLILLAFVFVVAAYVPGNHFKARVGHPMLIGLKLWAFAHLLVNGDSTSLILFGSFLAWSVMLYIASRKRDRLNGVQYPRGGWMGDAITVAVAAALWAGFAMHGHLKLIGVAPFG